MFRCYSLFSILRRVTSTLICFYRLLNIDGTQCFQTSASRRVHNLKGHSGKRFKHRKVHHHLQSLKSWEGGVRYPGFTYYPRPGEKDPPYEPSKLLMVKRIKPLKYNPHYFRKILQEFGLIENMDDAVLVKNIPENAARLWKIKHLIQILPVTFPHGYPEDGDFSSGYLDKYTGEFFVHKNIAGDERRIQATEEFISDPLRLDADTLIKKLRDRWLNSRL